MVLYRRCSEGHLQLSEDAPLWGEAVKALFFGSAGFGLKWLLGRFSGRAHDIRVCLLRLDIMGRDADVAMRGAQRNAADPGRAYQVFAERPNLIRDLRLCLGHRPRFGAIEAAFSEFAMTLRWADPHYGRVPSDLDIQQMRDREAELHRVIRSVASGDMSWKLSGHERAK
ncbi:MAG: hypothetical protein Q7J26_02885 [Brevundimonas sp.]|uniref:hypothetical protein n=1 Tax=Brevundimonas sp. TaxID=1871086 RepID=UPI0027213156|nr:hypothetical protein [Brevundimonas sp.]MDO9607446.1 hypothetical protein [Brevundimonas sp.]